MSFLRSLLLVLALSMSGAAVAQAMKPSGMSPGEAASRRFPQPVRVGDLVGRTVLEPRESEPVLGRVAGLVRRPDGGTAVVMQWGGVLGFGTRPIAVPLEAMVLLGEFMEVVDLTPDELGALPTYGGDDTALLAPDTIVKVGLAKPSH